MLTDDRVLDDLRGIDIRHIAEFHLGRKPKRNKICCTFHDENTPSMHLNPKTNRFKCFGCGATGSAIDLFASGSTGMSVGEAIREMKSKYLGVIDSTRPVVTYQIKPVTHKPVAPALPAELFSDTYEALQAFCRTYPATDAKRQALDYLTGRAFTTGTIRHFGLFVIPDVRAAASYLLASFSREHLQQAGLFAPPTGKGKGGFMFYKHPLVIPYYQAGRIVNLQGRCVGEPFVKGWKYQYLYDRPTTTMFNLDVLTTLEPGSKVYLTEGAFDAMAVTQKGSPAVSINSSTSFRPEWVKLFTGLRACFFFDNDVAGRKAVETLAPLFHQQQIPVSVKALPDNCNDVNEWLIKWSGYVNGYPAFWDQ